MSDERHYQFICPHCKKEIRYHRSYYDREIAKLAADVSAINAQITEWKALPEQERKRLKWRRDRLCRDREEKCSQLRELKAIRKAGNALVEERIEQSFRRLVKERIGEKAYIALREQAEQEIKAYTTEELMRVPYTRKGGKKITEVTK